MTRNHAQMSAAFALAIAGFAPSTVAAPHADGSRPAATTGGSGGGRTTTTGTGGTTTTGGGSTTATGNGGGCQGGPGGGTGNNLISGTITSACSVPLKMRA